MTNDGYGGHRGAGIVRCLAQRTDDAIIKGPDAVLLFLADLWLRLDHVPWFDDVILDLLNVDRTRNSVCTGHLLHIRPELAYI
jgi:hypothetical protein